MNTKFDIKDDGVLKFIEPYVTGKTILDIGCVEHDLKNIHKDRIWVHDYLRSVAKKVVGLDYLSTAVKELNRRGYDIVCQNAENIKLNKKFDIVFAGDLIEHLNNQGLFLDSVKRRMSQSSLLILTTPNVFSLQRLIPVFYKMTNDPDVNPEHTLFHSPKTLISLLTRNGFVIEKIDYAHYPVKKKNLKQKIVRALCPIIGKHFRETLLVVAKVEKNK